MAWPALGYQWRQGGAGTGRRGGWASEGALRRHRVRARRPRRAGAPWSTRWSPPPSAKRTACGTEARTGRGGARADRGRRSEGACLRVRSLRLCVRRPRAQGKGGTEGEKERHGAEVREGQNLRAAFCDLLPQRLGLRVGLLDGVRQPRALPLGGVERSVRLRQPCLQDRPRRRGGGSEPSSGAAVGGGEPSRAHLPDRHPTHARAPPTNAEQSRAEQSRAHALSGTPRARACGRAGGSARVWAGVRRALQP